MSHRELNEEDIAKLRQILGSSAWQEVMHPAIMGRVQVLTVLLVLPFEERGTNAATDDQIRGGIRELQWVATKFQQVVQQYDHNQRVESRDAELASASR